MDFAALLDHSRLGCGACVVGAVLLVAAGAVLAFPPTVGALLLRQALPFAAIAIPRSLEVESMAKETIAPSGDEVVLLFRAHGEGLSDALRGRVRIVPDGQPGESYPLTFEAEEDGAHIFQTRIPPSSVSFSYRAWLGDGRTREPARVIFEPRPAIVRQEAALVLPEFVGLRPDGGRYEEPQPRGDVAGVPGSAAHVRIETQKPVVKAVAEILGEASEDGAPAVVRRSLPMTLGEDGLSADVTFDLRDQESAYRILLEDRHGFTNLHPPRRNLALLPAEPPQVVLLPERFPAPGQVEYLEDTEVEGIPILLNRPVRIAYFCRAAGGLKEAKLRYRVNEGEWQTYPLTRHKAPHAEAKFDPQRGQFVGGTAKDHIELYPVPSADPARWPEAMEGGGHFHFQTRPLDLKVGDVLELYLEVFDRNPAHVEQPGRSETRGKTVVNVVQFADWRDSVLQQNYRIMQLEQKQQGVFPPPGTEPE
jgi:hypothetical protein